MKSLKIYTIINCKDCHEFHKIVDEVCEELNMSKQLVDVDIEENLKTNLEEMVKYDVMSIPHTLVCNDGVPHHGMSGILTKQQLLELINNV
jgi:hypothetical protein